MATQREVVYPSIAAFNSNLILTFGPYPSGFIHTLLRAEVRGKVNFQGETISVASVEANYQIWGLQWVSHGSPALDPVSSADSRQWMLREQLGSQDTTKAWTPAANTAASLKSYQTRGDWAGQMLISDNVDLYLAMRAPTGVVIPNMNYFGSIRWWWT